LGERLNKLVYGSLADADAAVFVLDATARIGPGDRLIASRLAESAVPVIVVVNKTDAASPQDITEHLVEAGVWDFAAYVPLSALRDEGMAPLVDELLAVVPDGPFFFPADMYSDMPDSLLAAELVREKYLARLHEELPHSVTVVVDDIETRADGMVYVPATVYVERDSQKGMVIGKGGELIKTVGAEARVELERLFAAPVYLDLRVRVEKDWQRRDQTLDRLGF